MHGEVGKLLWTICYLIVVLGLSAYGIHRYSIIYLYFRNRRCKPAADSRFADLPMVTVQLPIYNEMHVIERLLKSIGEIDYPTDKLEIQVLDDSTDETRGMADHAVAKLRARGFDAVVLRREGRFGFKAGALDYGFQKAKGEFFFILDADFVAPPNILRESIHYFSDPKVGMIQTRWGHINRSYSWLTRAEAILLDGHLVLEQTARSRTGRFFNFNGTAGLWRKSCIREAGGWQHDTLTEDLDLSYRAQLRGWKFVFLVDIVTPAELPVDIDGFKSQQHRWTKGSIQTCKKVLPRIWRSKLPLFIKIEATAHLTANFAYLLLAFLCVLLYPSSSGRVWRRGAVPSGCCGLTSRSLWRPRRRLQSFSSALRGSFTQRIGSARFGFSPLCWRSALVCRSTMRELFWKQFSIGDQTSAGRQSTVLRKRSSGGKAVGIRRCGQ